MAVGLSVPAAWAQTAPDAASTPPAAAPAPAPTDPLGRDTPRGTVLGFLTAGKDAKSEIATQYLRTDVKGADAAVAQPPAVRRPRCAPAREAREAQRRTRGLARESAEGQRGSRRDGRARRRPPGHRRRARGAAQGAGHLAVLGRHAQGGPRPVRRGQRRLGQHGRRPAAQQHAAATGPPLRVAGRPAVRAAVLFRHGPAEQAADAARPRGVAARLPGVRLHPQGPARADPAAGRGAGAAVVPLQRVAVAVRAAGWGHRREHHPHRGPCVAADPAERRSRTAMCADASPG